MERWGSIIALAVIALVTGFAGTARAQEYCVACTGPDAIYRCIIEGARPGGGQSLQMLCVTSMAKTGNHATCGVKRGTVFDCDGAVKRVPWGSVEGLGQQQGQPQQPQQPQLPAQPQAQGAAADPKEAKPKVEANPDAPPRTIADMVKRGNEQTAEQMKQTADQMKKVNEDFNAATKKSWDCFASLFKEC